MQWLRLISITGCLGVLYAVGGVIYYSIRRAELRAELSEELPGENDMFAGLAQGLSEVMLQSISLSWGLAVIVMASIVLLAPLIQEKADHYQLTGGFR